MISLQQQPAPVESTRASEIPEASPWFGWTDQDFAAYEKQVHEETEARYAALCAAHESGPVCDRCGSASAELHDRLCPTCWLTDLERAAEAEQTIRW